MNMIQKRQQMRGQSGFTLIELLVAIAILGVLAGVAVFAVGNLTEKSKTTACTTEKKTVETAIDAAKADLGLYPATLALLTPNYMKSNVSANWTYTVIPAAGATPESYTVVTNTGGTYKIAC
jgi:prepilin-type N-terminal cleavage/methylation domain-containing protein